MPSKIRHSVSYIDNTLNPPKLNMIEGKYVLSQLERIIRTYKANVSMLESAEGKRKEVLEVIARKETSTRGNYVRLLNKPDKTKEDNEALYTAIQQIEELYVVLPSVERRIRETERRLQAVYPPSFMELVFNEFEKLKGDI